MELSGVDYLLFNGGMTSAVQGQVHGICVTKIEKMTYFAEIYISLK